MLTIVPAGNDGSAGPGYGSIAGPGGAEAAVTVARCGRPTRGADGSGPGSGRAPRALRGRRAARRRAVRNGDRRGGARRPPYGREGDRGALLRGRPQRGRGTGGSSSRAARSPTTRSRRRRRPAHSPCSWTARCPRAPSASMFLRGSPWWASRPSVVAEVRSMLAAGIPITVSVGDVEVATRQAEGSIAAFSSRGLVLDGGLKPSLAAPGVSVPDLRARSRRRRRRALRDDQRDERRGGRDRRSRGRACPGPADSRRERAAGRARRVGAARGSRPGRVGRRARRPPCGGAAGAVLAALAALVRGCGLVRRRTRPADHERLEPAAVRLRGADGDRAEGRRDDRRPTAPQDPTRAERRGRRTRGHGSALVGGGRRHGGARSATGDSPEVHVPWAVAVPAPVDLVSRMAIALTGRACRTRPLQLSRSSPDR